MAIKNLTNTASALRNVLVVKGRVSSHEASDLLQKQLEELRKSFFESLSAKPKLEAALASLRKEIEKGDLFKSTKKSEAS